MWLHRTGYHPPNEPAAIHCRRRYRLMPHKVPNPNLPAPDPSLFIVHYSRAAPSDHIPANRIPVLPQVQAMMSQRRFLQSQGQLARKDFMLHDRNNWPAINFPPQVAPHNLAQAQGPYPGMAGRPPYYPHPGQAIPGQAGPTPPKVPRGHRASSAAMGAATADFALEDEDVSAGDMMDLLTPREVSKMRYQQHHEWMEEIFASPYAISQITPVSLGLGRKGELESLTAGFFDAPVAPSNGESKEDVSQVANMEPAKAEEFTERVTKKITDMNAEIEKLKKRHARRMEDFKRTSLLKDAEHRLRDAATDPAETGSEIWRMEGRIEVPAEDGTPAADPVQQKAKYKVDDIVRDVETSYGKQVIPEPNVTCVEKGGLLEKIEPQRRDENLDSDMLMDQPSTHFLDQFGTPPDQGMSNQGVSGPSAAAGANTAPSHVPDMDVDLGGDQGNTAPGETGDWVVLNNAKKDGADTTGTPGSGLQGLTPGNTGNGGDFDFTNLDSAGDALAAYNDDLPGMDNSAFGDAFHASDNEHAHHQDADEMS